MDTIELINNAYRDLKELSSRLGTMEAELMAAEFAMEYHVELFGHEPTITLEDML